MRVPFALIPLLLAITVQAGATNIVYQNTFDDATSLVGFTKFGEKFQGDSPAPLHSVAVESGQLRIQTSSLRPNGAGTNPTLLGQAMLMRDTSAFGGGYDPIISQSSGLVSWSFNLANQDGAFNNRFDFVLLSTAEDPYAIGAKGYALRGGGMVGNRMGLWRFDYGLGGGQSPVVDLTDGLGPLPSKGSLRITYDPAHDRWSLFAEIGAEFVDPESVNRLLGSGIDGTYTQQLTQFMGLGGGTTGLNIFDNVTVSVIPEPAGSIGLAAIVGLSFGFRRRYVQTD